MNGSRRALARTRREASVPSLDVGPMVQARAEDVVLAAALFKPNAAGWHEFAGGGGFGQRQLLKARGAYLAERVVIGVTPLHVHALAVFFGCRVSRAVGCWPRSDVEATAVDAVGDRVEPAWPAVELVDGYGLSIAELQVCQRDDDAWRVLALLFRGRTSSDR